ncbi:protein LLP-like protein [Dinothrombium tinctorium]|uniref:Protein LLP-like protein n=1 Tax=Dinothrombium tinctorium TaxID=1965070 RepID=A0A443R108_9ACAR|nr:protein LLP-like protein [Dinothrombium tinctorium]
MAKSLRSKWKRKMRALKRERYAVKELDRLKTMLSKAESVPDVEVVRPPNATTITNDATAVTDETRGCESIEMDSEQCVEKRDKRTLRNEHGNYPIWMNRRQVRRHKLRLRKKR